MTSEANCLRKSHRIDIPIQVIIQNATYQVTDWSTLGFKLTLKPEQSLDIKLSDEIDISLILPTGASSIVLNATANCKNINVNHYGFEIIKINDKNKRVLRHYATLMLDGNKNLVDDLSSNLFMTDIESPIKEPILLTEKEHKKVHKSFLKRFIPYTIIGFTLVALILFTVLYNYIIKHESTGLITGNYKNYTSPKDGKINKIYVQTNQKVKQGEILFDIDDTKEQEILQNLLVQDKMLKKQISKIKQHLQKLQQKSLLKEEEIYTISKQEIKQLNSMHPIYKTGFQRAEYLYKEQLITSVEFTKIQNEYLTFMAKYNDAILNDNSFNKNKISLKQQLAKNEDQIISLSKSLDTLEADLELNTLEILEVQHQVNASVITANEDGIIHNIYQKESTNVEYTEKIISLQTNQKPFILTKMFVADIASIYIGQTAIVYSKREDKYYRATITGVGYSITDGSSTNTTEISQNEIPIKIEFENEYANFYLNEYLKVYIINGSALAESLLQLNPNKVY